MKYKGTDYDMWDAWYMNVNGRVHGFHLKAQGLPWNVGHVVTDDLLHFTRCDDILKPLDEKTHPDDCLGKYTGCAYYDEKSAYAYVYYTMRDKNASEKIGVAISEDMVNFPEFEGNPVIEIDEKLLVKNSKPTGSTDCRDLLVIFDEKSGKYYGYFAAMANVSDRYVGVIVVCESDDLIHWDNQRIVFVPEFNGVIEVPDVFCIDGKWYLTMLTGKRYGAYGIESDPNICGFTIYATADSPTGPFVMNDDCIFICGTYNSGYSCRSVEFGGKRYVLYIDKSEYGSAISFPKEIKVVDGKLRPCYADILKALRTEKSLVNPRAQAFKKVPTAFAWETFGGDIKDKDGGLELTSGRFDCQRFVSEGFTAKSLEAEAKITGDCSECGFCVFTYDQNGNKKDAYTVSVGFDDKELAVYTEAHVSLAFTPHFKRRFAFEREKEYHLRIIAGDGQLEIYIDGALALQGNMLTNDSMKPGVFCANGNAKLSDIYFYELESQEV